MPRRSDGSARRRARFIRNRVIGIVRRLRARVDRVRPRPVPALDFTAVHRRIELLLAAMYGPSIATGVMAQETGREPGAQSIVLPRSIPEHGDAIERYRLLAIEQGARIARGTRAAAPADPMEHDLYMIVEGAAVDAALIERAPGLARAIARLRREELDRRSRFSVGPASVPVENLLRQLLATDPRVVSGPIPRTSSPAESAGVARRMAGEIRLGMKRRARYASIQGVALWDDAKVSAIAKRPEMLPGSNDEHTDSRQSGDGYGGRGSEGTSDVAVSDGSSDSPREEGTPNENESANEASANAQAAQASASEGGASATGEAGPQSHDDVIAPDGDAEAVSGQARPRPGGIQYPEWVDRFKRLEPRHVTVYASEAAEGDATWARGVLREHAAMVRRLRDRFSLLRARRMRLKAQQTGDELDLDACVNAFIDLSLDRVPSDRLYEMSRSNRHSLAITILVDASGSTRQRLPDGKRVIDVERLSVVLASEALSSLGDPYSILAFTGATRHNVTVSAVKRFDETDLEAMHRRVSRLEPGENTRLGAAVRHATALLLRQPAQRHVLLILSDGRPNDLDWYWSDGAVEDSRVAILEARAAGVHPFCITVDSEEADYLPHLFGEGRYWVLSDPADLPKALIRLIDTILAA